MNVKETILEESLYLFSRHGIRALSKAQLEAHLGISHAAFDEIFQNKADLVQKTVAYLTKKLRYEYGKTYVQSQSAIEATLLMLKNASSRLENFNPFFFRDLQKYYPSAWQLYLDYIHTHVYQAIFKILNRGVIRGEFRKDINLELVTKIMLEMYIQMLNPLVFPPSRYNLAEVFRCFFLYYMEGLCVANTYRMVDEFFA
ncbi:TetR/AcrR family transcriptional regulator [Adhaeribacter sp. BT258]|uniref:TetR/AcrR family transcriptional regulator n=1 Tax=Adhaeribacter terrigena TaxID=2793070 RepID=A0ABS1C4I3_9BACT|nr:TetR family transcriptional regulator [Adhaeribacter terrigena]MBK0404228.1 TetR/AcrR family transcriptional regulator [Adhaeribacter terrigena]